MVNEMEKVIIELNEEDLNLVNTVSDKTRTTINLIEFDDKKFISIDNILGLLYEANEEINSKEEDIEDLRNMLAQESEW